MYDLTYPERLKMLDIDSLEMRRLRADLVLAYKIHFGLLKTTINFSPSTIAFTRGHKFKLRQSIPNTDLQKYTFTSRVIPIWNSLHSADFTSLSSFTRNLTSDLLTDFLTIKY